MSSRRHIFLMLILLATVVAVAFPPGMRASIRYVATTGSNGNAGTEVSPWRDIQYAISTSSTVSGDTVLVENGTYTENITISGKSLVVASRFLLTTSTGDIDNTIINGNASGNVVSISTSSTLIGFTITNGDAVLGGGVYTENASPLLSHLKVQGNHASGNGGGMYFASSDAVLANLTVTGNSADGNGGGLYMENSSISCSNMTVTYNTSSNSGGGLYVDGGSPEFTSLSIMHNAASMDGGGAYLNNANPAGRDWAVQYNEALGYGGGIYADSVQGEFDELSIEDNDASSFGGGGIYVSYCSIGLDSSFVRGNAAGTDGGGIFAVLTSLKLTQSTVNNNEAMGFGFSDGSGGGLYLIGSDPYLYNTTISGNTAHTGNGGGLYHEASLDAALPEHGALPSFFDGLAIGAHSCVIDSNNAQVNGGGYYLQGNGGGRGMPTTAATPVEPALVSVDNSSISYNSAGESGGGIYGDVVLLSVESSSMNYNTASFSGGGMYLRTVQALLVNSEVSHNWTLSSGGGLRAEDSDIYSDSTSYRSNRVAGDIDFNGDGGGVYHNGLYTGMVPGMPVAALPAEVFSGRRLGYRAAYIENNSVAYNGGGLYLQNVSLSVLNSTINHNTADADGGGLYAGSSQVLVDSCFVNNNSSVDGGGGIHLASSDVYAAHTQVNNNSSSSGGGVYQEYPYDGIGDLPTEFEGYTLGYSNMEFTGNGANSNGGGLFLRNTAIALSNSTLSTNTASKGGGLYVKDASLIVDSTVVYSNIANQSGGGIFVDYSAVYSTGATFSYNEAQSLDGGAILQQYDLNAPRMPSAEGTLPPLPSMFNGRQLGYFDATIEWNTAGRHGGGIRLLESAPRLSNMTLHDNSCGSQGGGISIFGGDSDENFPQVVGLTIQQNYAANGGGLAMVEADVVISNTTVLDNSSDANGGGLYIVDSAPSIDSTVVRSNRSGADGGGLYIDGATDADVLLSNLSVADNSASGSGGGLYLRDLAAIMSNMEVRGNAGAGYGGGGIFLTTTDAVFENTLLSGNFARTTYLTDCGGGGGLYAELCPSVVVKNTTITGNKTEDNGGAILLSATTLRMMNGIVWGNHADISNDDILLCMSSEARLYNSIINPEASMTEAVDNIGCDPRFVDATDPSFAPTTSGNLHLQNYSPAIGAGTTTVTIASVVVTAPLADIEHTTRGATPDMGAYENALDLPASSVISMNDEQIICDGDPVTIDVLANDEDIFENTPLIVSYTQGTRGTVSYGMDGLFLVYTADSVFSGVDTFTYTVSTATCNAPTTATVTIYSDPVMVAPVIAGESVVFSGGAQYVYTAASTTGVTYAWSAVNGSVVSSSGNSVTVAWNDTYSGTVVVTAATALGCAVAETLAVRIYHPGPLFYVCSSGSNVTGTGSESAPLAEVELAIDLASEGDTVLICPGIYNDEFAINKNVVVGSWFLTTGDSSYIAQTVINSNRDYTTVIFGPGLSSTASLVGLTITGGANEYGGGIIIDTGSTPVLRDLVITDNFALVGAGIYMAENSAPLLSNITINNNSSIAAGGGIYMDYGTAPRLTNVTIADNRAYYVGGGILMEGASPILSNVTISGNTCFIAGGGIYMAVSTPQLSNCTIENNSVTFFGGGIYILTTGEEPPMPAFGQVAAATTGTIIDNSIIRNNTAMQGNGGGLYISNTMAPLLGSGELPIESDPEEISITNTVIDSNYAFDNGGGLAFYDIQPYLGNVTVVDNSCGNSGGGIYIEQSELLGPSQPVAGMPLGDARIDSSVVKRNYAGQYGGGIMFAGEGSCIECLPSTHSIPPGIPLVQYISSVQIDSNGAGLYGGGIAAYSDAAISIENSRISHNRATWGGGIDVGNATIWIEGSSVDSNAATNGGGGGLSVYESSVFLASSSFSANMALDGSGGGIYGEYFSIGADSVTVTGNGASDNGGGLLLIDGTVEMSNSTVTDNSSGGDGGGLYAARLSTSAVEHLLFNGNRASGNGGGATFEYSSIDVDSTVFTSNTSVGNGGGLHVYFSASELSNLTVAGNSAGANGGGIYRYSEPGESLPATGGEIVTKAIPFISNSVIAGNFSSTSLPCSGGGGITLKNVSQPVVFSGVTISGNNAPNGTGGGLLISGATADLVNSIVWSNNADIDENISRCTTAVARAYYSLLHSTDVDSAYAIIECSPLFVEPVDAANAPTTTGNLRLLDNSPAIGMGVESIELAVGTVSVTATDMDGTTHGTPPDIGAFENVLDIPLRTIVATNDTSYGCLNAPLFVDVLANDTDSGEKTFIEYSQGTRGTVSVSDEPYGLLYSPNEGFTGTDSFTYVVSTNACARPDTAMVMVHIGQYPELTISGTNAVCSFSTHTFTVNDENGVATLYEWLLEAPGAATAPVIVGSSTGTSVVVDFGEFTASVPCSLSVRASTPNGCEMNSTFVVNGYSQPIAHAGNDKAVCSGSTVSLGSVSGEVFGTATGGSGMYSYSWTPADGLDYEGSAAPEVTPASTATYTVVATDLITGCTATDDVTVTVHALPALVINTTSGCGGQITTYTATDTNNTGASIHWNTEMLSCGTVVENTNGMLSVLWSSVSETTTCVLFASAVTPQECEESFSFDIAIHPLPVLAINGAESVCSGSTESYTVVDSNSTGASYEWSVSGGAIVGSSSSATISVLWSTISEGTTGEVAVTATSPDGCSVQSSMEVQLNTNPVVGISGTDSVFAGTVHDYTATTEGESLAYSWNVNGGTIVGSTSGSVVTVRWSTNNTVTTTGSVVLTAVSNQGCSTMVQLPIDIYPFIPVDIAGDSLTVGDTTGVYGVAGVDTTTTSFEWTVSTGGTIVGSTTGATITVEWEDVDEPTTGTLTVQVLALDGGTGTTTFTVTIYPRPILSISGGVAVCSGEQQTYSVADSRNTGSTYGWFAPGGIIIGSSTGSTVTVRWNNTSVLSTTSLVVIGYEPHGFNGTTNVNVTVYPNPALSISGNTDLCGTASAAYAVADANSTGITSFNWSVSGGAIVGPATDAAITIVWDNTTTATQRSISVSGAGMNDCSSSTSLVVIVRPLPLVQIDGQNVVCDQSVVAYTATDMNSTIKAFAWSVDGGAIISGQGTTTATVQWNQPGARSIKAVATSEYGCTDSLVFAVEVFAKPQPEIVGLREVCADSTALLDAGDGYASYLWSNGAKTRTIVVATSGVYSVTVTTGDGCSSSTSATITYLPRVVAQAGDDVEICSGAGVKLQGAAVSYIGDVAFSWSPATGLNNPNIADPIASPASTTIYTLIVTDGYGCSASDEVTVVVKPEPNVQVTGSTVICTGGSTQLFAAGGIAYSWSPATGLSDTTIANPIVSPMSTMTYTLTVMSTTACTVQRQVTVTVVDPQFASAGDDVDICAGSSTQLQASGGVSYSWSPTTGLSNPNIANPIASPTETTVYTVTATGLGECLSLDQVTVTVRPLELDVTVLLEGAYTGMGMETSLQQQGLIPNAQPFNSAPFSYNGTETFDGSVSNVVDWVLLELRSSTSPSSMIARKAALLLADGKVVGTDGAVAKIGNIPAGSTPVYVVVWHRNHLPVMSSVLITPTNVCGVAYDFTGSLASAYTQFMDAQKQLGTAGAPYGLVAGDANGDGIVNAGDRVLINNASGQTGYLLEDLSLDGIVNAVDRVRVRNNVFYVTQVP